MTRLATDSEGAVPLNTQAKIGVAGCTGRVGSIIVKELQARHWGPEVSLAGGSVKKGIKADVDFFTTENPDDLFEISDVVIDFTAADATAKNVWLAAKHKKAIVIGTTGLSEVQEKEILDAGKEIPIVYAANMSIGVNLLAALIEKAAQKLGTEYDIEISETHHKHKIDAPSGTALLLGRAAAQGREKDLSEVAVYQRHGQTGERSAGTIGFSVQRGGDVVGEHMVTFYGEGERIELGHKATDRSLFAKGAIRAALWVKDQNPGVYSMKDVLGF
jgi:4-hydroxy-tetrahydrodipicolinate reductase